MNKAIRIASIVMLAVLVMGALAMPALAANVDLKDFEGVTDNADGIVSVFNNIIGIVQVIGTGIAVIMLLVIAIKYLVAAPSEKADIKKSAIPYAIAAAILFKKITSLIFFSRMRPVSPCG